MIIQSSNIQLSSRHAAVNNHVTKESLKAWVGAQRPDFEDLAETAARVQGVVVDTVSISAEARAKLKAVSTPGVQQPGPTSEDAEPQLDSKTQMLKMIVERMIGRKIRVLSLQDIQGGPKPENLPDASQAKAAEAPPRQGWGVEYDRQETTVEMETTNFSAQGVVQTADGKEIRFDINLTMSRQFVSQENTSIRLGDAVKKDPLVINFNGAAVQLTNTKFNFDLDADGKQDQISFVGSGSGFLAIDRNGDGAVNDGSELFGPKTSNGFAELVAYDADKNNWIDESDAVFADLRVWTKDAQGNDSLSTLAETGVGAIYLGSASTPFDIKDGQNALMGQIKSSGVVLNENGTVGTIQQVDLAVAPAQADPESTAENGPQEAAPDAPIPQEAPPAQDSQPA